MGPLILGVVVDVLIHVRIELRHSVVVRLISSAAWFLTVLNSGEFIVLNPKIGFENFRCGGESEHSCIARVEVWFAFGSCRGHERGTGSQQSCACRHTTKKCSPPKHARRRRAVTNLLIVEIHCFHAQGSSTTAANAASQK